MLCKVATYLFNCFLDLDFNWLDVLELIYILIFWQIVGVNLLFELLKLIQILVLINLIGITESIKPILLLRWITLIPQNSRINFKVPWIKSVRLISNVLLRFIGLLIRLIILSLLFLILFLDILLVIIKYLVVL